MEWITSNWILLLIVALCIGMHFFGRGCCAHGKDDKNSEDGDHHNGDTDACSLDESSTKKGRGSCH